MVSVKNPNDPVMDEDSANFFINYLNKKIRANNKKLRDIEALEKTPNRNADQEQKIKNKQGVLDSTAEYERIQKVYQTALWEQFPHLKPGKSGNKQAKGKKEEPKPQQVEESKVEEKEAVQVVQKPDNQHVVREILDLVHIAQYVKKSSRKREFISEVRNISEIELEVVTEFFDKVFEFPQGAKFDKVREKLDSSTAELSLYLQGSEKAAIGNKSYKVLLEAVERIAGSELFLNRAIEIEAEPIIGDESTNIPAIGSEVTQKNQSKPVVVQQTFQPTAVSNVVHQTYQTEEDLEEGDKSFKDEEDEGERRNDGHENQNQEPHARNDDQEHENHNEPEQENNNEENNYHRQEYNRGGRRGSGRARNAFGRGGRYGGYRGGANRGDRGGYQNQRRNQYNREEPREEVSREEEGGFVLVKPKFKLPPNVQDNRDNSSGQLNERSGGDRGNRGGFRRGNRGSFNRTGGDNYRRNEVHEGEETLENAGPSSTYQSSSGRGRYNRGGGAGSYRSRGNRSRGGGSYYNREGGSGVDYDSEHRAQEESGLANENYEGERPYNSKEENVVQTGGRGTGRARGYRGGDRGYSGGYRRGGGGFRGDRGGYRGDRGGYRGRRGDSDGQFYRGRGTGTRGRGAREYSEGGSDQEL